LIQSGRGINPFVATQRGEHGRDRGLNNKLIQEPEEAGQMAVIMSEVEFPGLLARVGFFRKCFVLVIVMTEVLRSFSLLVPAII